MTRTTRLLLLSISGVAATTCGNAGDGDRPPTPENPLYSVSTEVSNASDVWINYLLLGSSLETSASFDLARSIEAGEGSVGVYGGAIYFAQSKSPTITRFALGPGGKLERGPTMSLANTGAAGVGDFRVVGAHKGYVFDAANRRAFLFHPTDMVLTGKEVDLSAIERPGFDALLGVERHEAKLRGDLLLLPVRWLDRSNRPRNASGLLVLDTSTDQVVQMSETERCGGAGVTVETPSGDIYYFQYLGMSADLYYGTPSRPSCALRVRSGENRFDPDYLLDLSAVAGGRPTHGAIPDGSGRGLFFKAFREELEASKDPLELLEASYQRNWGLWHYDLETGAAREVLGFPLHAGAVRYHEIGGRLFHPVMVQGEDRTYKTTYYEAVASELVERFTVEGFSAVAGRLEPQGSQGRP